MTQHTYNTSIKPDRVIRLSELKPSTMLYRIASAMVIQYGHYFYTELETGIKVKVIAG